MTSGRYGYGYRAALGDLMDCYESGGLDRVLEWIEDNADSLAPEGLRERAKAARGELADNAKAASLAATMAADKAYTDGFKAGRRAEREDPEPPPTATAVRCLVIEPDGAHRVETIVPELNAVKALLHGGWLQVINGKGDWHAYIDEEGKIKGQPVNRLATRLAQALGWVGMPGDVLCGPVVFFGNDDPGEGDVPQIVWEVLHNIEVH
jgi:hypothetical protein